MIWNQYLFQKIDPTHVKIYNYMDQRIIIETFILDLIAIIFK